MARVPHKHQDPDLDARLAALAAAQPVPTSKAALVRAICEAACAAFEQTRDPLAWRPMTDVACPTCGDQSHPAGGPDCPDCGRM